MSPGGIGARVARGAAVAAVGAYAWRRLFPSPAKSVNGRTVLVTGAASGVGRELALELARRGAELVLWDVQRSGLDQTRELVLQQFKNAKVQTMVCNLADADDISRSVAKLPRIDVLINNAGVISGKYFTDIAPARMELTMRVNVISHMLLVRALLPGMIERNSGHIACVGSVAVSGGAGGGKRGRDRIECGLLTCAPPRRR
jgi:all-trans-retinol dehydrogenase (NAD+)